MSEQEYESDIADEGGAAGEAEAEPPFDTDGLPVSLVFVAGETTVPLADLRRVAPGYTFELGRPVTPQVEIRANGAVVGKGELVEIDGRLGVRMVECKGLPAS